MKQIEFSLKLNISIDPSAQATGADGSPFDYIIGTIDAGNTQTEILSTASGDYNVNLNFTRTHTINSDLFNVKRNLVTKTFSSNLSINNGDNIPTFDIPTSPKSTGNLKEGSPADGDTCKDTSECEGQEETTRNPDYQKE
jgi:hypothetical protein